MKTGSKAILFVLSMAGLGTAGYLLTRKSNATLRQEILLHTQNIDDRQRIATIVTQMTRQELLDTLKVFQTPESSKAAFDPAFKDRVIMISNKYNIFT